MANNVTRSTVNEQQYAAPAFQKSGFPLSYRKYSSYLLGRLHVSGYQNCMPGDKISGQNKGNFTMKRIVTPMVSDIEVGQYNFWIPFRALDRTFERAFAPSKNNNMSAAWSAPSVSTRYLVGQILRTYFGFTNEDVTLIIDSLVTLINTAANNPAYTLNDWIDYYNQEFATNYSIGDLYDITNTDISFIASPLFSLRSGLFHQMAEKMYLGDALLDIANNIEVKLGSAEKPLSGSILLKDFAYLYLDTLLTPWIGRFSYYGEFKYKYVRPFDLYRVVNKVGTEDVATLDSFIELFDNTPQSEYALRAMYVIWYEHFRNVDLEPVSSDLPYWRDFGSTSIFDMSAGGNLCYLIYRIRPWYEDMFTTAQIDDLSRHIYAPIIDVTDNRVSYHESDLSNYDTNTEGDDFSRTKPAVYSVSWQDQLTGQRRYIECPVPTNINDILSSQDLNLFDVYGLDLNTLRQSQMLERYLKRNYLFGDEYQDRMLAHYNSRVSDMRINRPELLSSSLNNSNMDQEVANVSTGETNVGDRTATGTLSCEGDQFTTFCEEFGILVNLITFMPLASYDGIQPQLLCQKVVDFPLPEFATNNEEFGRKMEIADSALDSTLIGQDGSDNRFMFGRYPAYHAWRQRVDEVGGDFLDELQDCTFRRFWGMFSDDTTPKLNYYFLHCRPNLGMFANTNLYDAQIYGDVVHECYVERVLPTPVETI